MLATDLIHGAAGAATYLGVPRNLVYKLVASGDLPVIRMGPKKGAMFFRKSELDRAFSSAGAA